MQETALFIPPYLFSTNHKSRLLRCQRINPSPSLDKKIFDYSDSIIFKFKCQGKISVPFEKCFSILWAIYSFTL